MINLDTPKKATALVNQAYQAAAEVFRPLSRKYDKAEHSYPRELDMLASLIDGLNSSGQGGAGATGAGGGETSDAAEKSDAGESGSAGESSERQAASGTRDGHRASGTNLRTVLGTIEMCWGDVALLLSMPRQGLGNAAIAAVADAEQQQRFAGLWAAMAITEPHFGSDSAAVATTAELDGDEYVLNGEKIYVTAGERADAVVVWATLDKKLGRPAIKSFVVEKSRPGLRVERLEHKLGIRASDTAALRLENCRVPKENLLGSPEIDPKKGFAGVMETFDNTRPLVAAMAVGLARAALEETAARLDAAGMWIDYDAPAYAQHAAAATYLRLEADFEAARVLTLSAAWMADNRQTNSLQASMSKAKAGRSVVDITLRCVELCGTLGYSEASLLEKWARDAKILDIFEGTQQIQQLIIARRLLGKTSAELK